MLRRLPFLVPAAALFFLLLAVGSASPASTPDPEELRAGAGRVFVDPAVVPRGEKIKVWGKGWKPGKRVWLGIGPPASEAYPFASPKVNKRGRFSTSARVKGLPSLYVILACSDSSCKRKASTRLRIVRSSSKKQTTLLHTDLPKDKYLEKPRRVGYEGSVASIFLETIRLRGLKWRTWGKGKSIARGRVTVCLEDRCRSSRARVKATRRVRYESKEWFYSRLVVTFKRDVGTTSRKVMLCTLPAICGGPPGPP